MSDLADSMPKERELIAGALRAVEHRFSDWYTDDPVVLATDAVLPVVAELIAEAEKRGAVKGAVDQLRNLEAEIRLGQAQTPPDLTLMGAGLRIAADMLRARAAAIESGQVTP